MRVSRRTKSGRVMSKRARITTSLRLATLIRGCVPIPLLHARRIRHHPERSPVAGAEARVSGQFVDEDRVATTGTDGRFATGPIREFSFVRPLLCGDRISDCLVEIAAGGKTYKGYHSGGIVTCRIPLKIRRDLSLPLALDSARAYCVPERRGASPKTPRPRRPPLEGRPL